MTLKLSDLLEMATKMPTPVAEIHVSPRILDQLLVTRKDQTDLERLKSFDCPLILEPHYKPGWWSEHYSEKIVLHTEDATISIPSVSLHHVMRPFHKKFLIKRSPMKEKTLGQIGYEAYCKFTDNKSLISGAELPAFVDLKTPIQEAWEKAGQAVAASVGRGDKITGVVYETGEVAPGEPEVGQIRK